MTQEYNFVITLADVKVLAAENEAFAERLFEIARQRRLKEIEAERQILEKMTNADPMRNGDSEASIAETVEVWDAKETKA